MVAGLAIQVQHPFDIDDWIQFDYRREAHRARARDQLARDEGHHARSRRGHRPQRDARQSAHRQLHEADHHLAAIALRAGSRERRAAQRADARSSTPSAEASGWSRIRRPSVVTNAFIDGNVEYWVRFFSDQFDKRDKVDGAARDRIWYAFARAGIPLAFTNQSIHLHEVSSEERASEEQRVLAREKALKNVDFLRVLPEEHRHTLAAQSRIYLYGAGESIVRQGDDSSRDVHRRERRGPRPPRADEWPAGGGARAPRSGHVLRGDGPRGGRAANGDGSRAHALHAHRDRSTRASPRARVAPEIAEHVSRVIAERQAMLAEREAAALKEPSASVQERSSLLLGRIRKFFCALRPSLLGP